MSHLITLMSFSCPKRCRHCSYGTHSPVSYETIAETLRSLQNHGHRVHFYDMHVTTESVRIFRQTRQFEAPNPGWLNVNHDFDPGPEDLEYLNSLDVSLVVSLHGATAATHALLSGDATELDAILAALRRWRSRLTIPLGINYVVHRQNVEEIPAILALPRDRLDVDFIEFINLGYGGSSRRYLDSQDTLDRETFIRAYNHLRRGVKRLRSYVRFDSQWGPDFVGMAPERCGIFAAPLEDRYCNAGINQLALRADTLEVWPCPALVSVKEAMVGVCREGQLELERDFWRELAPLDPPCGTCDKLEACGGACRAIAIGDTLAQTGVEKLNAGFLNCLYTSYRAGRIRLSHNPQRSS